MKRHEGGTRPESGLAARAAAWRDADPDPRTRAELDLVERSRFVLPPQIES